jgi:hypothetical protein
MDLMDLVGRFSAYAAEFEKAYTSRHWSSLGAFFADDAVYRMSGGPPLGGEWRGREAVVAHLQHSVDSFDREFDERILRGTAPPVADGPIVTVQWSVVYRLEGAPDLQFDGTERVTFRGLLIEQLDDRVDSDTSERIRDYAEEYLGGRSR